MKKLSKETGIGLSVVLAILFLVWGIHYLKGLNLLQAHHRYYAVFDQTSGLTLSAPVCVNGFQVGTVRNISCLYQQHAKIVVEMALDKELSIPQGSIAILTPDVIGSTTIQLSLSNQARFHSSGDTLLSSRETGLMEMLSQDLMININELLKSGQRIMHQIECQLGDEGALNHSLRHLEDCSEQLAQSSSKLNHLLSHSVPNVLQSTESTVRSIGEVGEALAQIDFKACVDSLSVSIAQVQQLLEGLNRDESSIGRLLNDSTLYLDLQQTIQSANNLLQDIQTRPKKYVHFSVFGN